MILTNSSESDLDGPAPPPRAGRAGRKRPLAAIIRENHEAYNVIVKKKIPKLLRQLGVSSDDSDWLYTIAYVVNTYTCILHYLTDLFLMHSRASPGPASPWTTERTRVHTTAGRTGLYNTRTRMQRARTINLRHPYGTHVHALATTLPNKCNPCDKASQDSGTLVTFYGPMSRMALEVVRPVRKFSCDRGIN